MQNLFTMSDINYFMSVQRTINNNLMKNHNISDEEWKSDEYAPYHGAMTFTAKADLVKAAESLWSPFNNKKVNHSKITNASVDFLNSLMHVSLLNDEEPVTIMQRTEKGLQTLKDEPVDGRFLYGLILVESFEMNMGCLVMILNEFGIDRESFISAYNNKTKRLTK